MISRPGLAQLGLLLCVGLAGGCAESATETTPTDSATPHTNGADLVEVHDNQFAPDSTEVDIGDTVAWDFSTARRPHNVVFDAGFESEILDDGTWTTTFDEPGNYPYRCTLHAGMTGRITVADR